LRKVGSFSKRFFFWSSYAVFMDTAAFISYSNLVIPGGRLAGSSYFSGGGESGIFKSATLENTFRVGFGGMFNLAV
jgi:hypothetical protein